MKISSIYPKLKSRLESSPFHRNVMILVGGSASSQALLILSAPLIVRLYTPEEIGILTIFISLLSILTNVSSMQYEQAIPISRDGVEETHLISLCLGLIVLGSFGIGYVFQLWKEQITHWLNAPLLEPHLWLLSLCLIWSGSYEVLRCWAIRNKAFPFLMKTKISQSVGFVSVQTGAGVFGLGSLGLLLSDCIGRAISSVQLAYLLLRQNSAQFKRITWKGIASTANRYRRFPLLSSGSVTINNISLQLPALSLAILYGAQVTGWYTIAQRVCGIPFTVLGATVGDVFIAEAASITKSDPKRIHALFWKTIKHMVYVGLPVLCLIALGAPILFSLVFGHSWSESGTFLQILAVMFFMQFVLVPVSGIIYVFERQDLHLYRELFRIVFTAAGFVIAGVYHLSPLQAIGLLSISGTLAYLVNGFTSWLAIRKEMIKCTAMPAKDLEIIQVNAIKGWEMNQDAIH